MAARASGSLLASWSWPLPFPPFPGRAVALPPLFDASAAHAFSAPADWPADWRSGQPMNWTVTGVAYGGEVAFTDGSSFKFVRRERPHLLWRGGEALALSNGVQYVGALDMPNADATFTLVQPLARS